jgi:GT2 family glycosyltransferase
METVCAVIVTYNRKALLLECIYAIYEQSRPVQALYIIDNASTDGTEDALLNKGHIKSLPPNNLIEPWEHISETKYDDKLDVNYVKMHKNSGGAGGFYEGMNRAYNKGYEWLWLMDDDGKPDKKCLENLLKHKKEAHFICPLVLVDKNSNILSFGLYDYQNQKKYIGKIDDIIKKNDRRFLINTANPFNGALISRQIISKIGFPKKEMFIWGDETEYMLRTQKNGFKVITVLNSIHYHPKQKKEAYKSVIGLGTIFYTKDPTMLYIYIRNYAYLESRYKIRVFLQSILKYFVFFIFQKKPDKNEIIIFVKGAVNGLFNNFKPFCR